MFKIDSDNLGGSLVFIPDIDGTHGVIEPSKPMTLTEYQKELNRLQKKFKKVCPS